MKIVFNVLTLFWTNMFPGNPLRAKMSACNIFIESVPHYVMIINYIGVGLKVFTGKHECRQCYVVHF